MTASEGGGDILARERDAFLERMLQSARGTPSAETGTGGATMTVHDIPAASKGLRELVIKPGIAESDAEASMQFLGPFNQCSLGVVRFSGRTPWERHPDGDELLHVLEGEIDVTVLGDGGPAHAALRAGSVFVVPRGLWHQQFAPAGAALLFATPADTTEHSWAEDPRPKA
jgi:quercetin dioxygenase-like cupin family protein